MVRTCVIVDVQTVRLIIDYIGVCAECVKDGLCNVPRATIGAVQADLNTLEGVNTQRNQITHVAVAACHIVHGAADVLTVRKRQLRPVWMKQKKI